MDTSLAVLKMLLPVKVVWYLLSAFKEHPVIATLLLLSVIALSIVLLAHVATLLKHKLPQAWNEKIALLKNVPAGKAPVATLLVLCIFFFAWICLVFKPYQLQFEPEKITVVIFPVFDVASDGHLEVASSSELFQSEVAKKFSTSPEDGIGLKILDRDALPFAAYKANTLAELIGKIEKDNSYFFYLMTVKRGESFEKVDIALSPTGGDSDPKSRKLLEAVSQKLSIFANQYRELPQATISQLSGGILSALTTQSLNHALVDYGLFNEAQSKAEAAIKEIATLRQETKAIVSESRSKDLDRLLSDIEKEFETARKNIIAANPRNEVDRLYKQLKKRPFAPLASEHAYVSWLLKQDGFYSFSRLVPLGGLKIFDSDLERLILNASRISPAELSFAEVQKMLDQILPNSPWLKKYYLSILVIVRKERSLMGAAIEDFAKINQLAPEFSERERIAMKAIATDMDSKVRH